MTETHPNENSTLLPNSGSSNGLNYITEVDGTEDPMNLKAHKQSQEHLSLLIKQGRHNVHSFYSQQNELIEDLLNALEPEEDESENLLKLKIAINGSVIVNIILLVLQMYAAFTTGSLSLFATMADAFMDLLSSIILLLAGWAADNVNHFLYPTGKSRLETAGIIVFSSLMATVSINLMVEGIKALVYTENKVELTIASIACIVAALASKFVLYVYCSLLSKYPSAQILALDHRNDIVVNVFGLSMSLLGHNLYWWMDPIGCLLVALFILRSWVSTALEQIDLIVGKAADPDFLKKLTYISMTHDPRIKHIDTCRAYHAGNNFFVEVDIVLDPNTPLHESHDIAESLQIKLESLQTVERAFVHADYEFFHPPEH